jgi:beta-glucosidase
MSDEYEALAVTLDVPAKVRLLTGASMFTLQGADEIGLAPMAFSDGPTGVRGLTFSGGRRVSLLPNATLLASSWDEGMLAEVGGLLAEEAARQEIHVVLGPTINLHRSPLGGRLFEAYSEDPLLTGRLAAAYVRGLQARGIGACLKHLVANESETERHTMDSRLDASTLRELYLLPFEIAVADSDPWSIMAAYNDVNGVPATEQDDVMNGIVKGEWGWSGLIMSDWFATKSAAPAANGGLDLVMPGPHGPWGDALVAAVEAGEVSGAVLDDHVVRLLRLADRVGALGKARQWPAGLPEPTDDVRREALVRYAAAGMTVLKNDAALPLDAAATVALIGRPALDTTLMGGGSAQVNPPHQITVAAGLTAALPGAVVVDGVEVRTRPVKARPGFVVDPSDGRPGMHVRLYAADGDLLADEHVDDTQRLVGFDDDLPKPATRARLAARIEHTGRVQLGVIGLGSWALAAGDFSDSVVLRPVTGDHGEGVLTPPPHTVEVDLDGPTVLEAEVTVLPDANSDRPGGLFTMVGLIARPAPRPDEDAIADAVAAARSVEVAVVVVGLTEEEETEARDKTTLALPGAQDALVTAVAEAAPRTVVVVNSATPVLMPWAGRVDAILVAGLPGQEGGTAVAAALLGVLEPSGRLVTTWPAADGAATAWSVTPVDGALPYSEGRFLGYRGHAAGQAPAPAWWFGHGLGYGSWEYADARVAEGEGEGEAPTVTVSVRNTSARRSREVVQVYFAPADTTHPVRLVGWAAAEVPAGESAEVTVACDARMWRRWDDAAGDWAPLDPDGELLVARGLGDVRHRLRVRSGGHQA